MQRTANPPSTALSTLHHVAVVVTDVSAAVAWYGDRFRCEVTYQDDTWALLRFANTSIALVLPDQHPAHAAFLADLTGREGVRRHRDGTRYLYEQDPWGNTVEHLEL